MHRRLTHGCPSQVLDVTPVNEVEICDLFHCGLGDVKVNDVCQFLQNSGLSLDDPRLSTVYAMLESRQGGLVSIDELTELKRSHLLVQKAMHSELAVPDFEHFTKIVSDIYASVQDDFTGELPMYIPQLAQVDSKLWGVSVCTVDGQRFSIGDSGEIFSVQSVCKPINYAIAIDALGVDKVHGYVGMEPSGRNFNERVLLPNGTPHNPLINTGAIRITSLLFPKGSPRWQGFETVTNIWTKMGTGQFQVLTSTYLAERECANRNFCLAHMIAENSSDSDPLCFPKDSKSIESLLDDYFAFCSLGVTTREMSVVAATLANGGLNPITEIRAVSSDSATATLSLMMTCGMYDASGEFSYTSGFPAKSGVSGIIMAVIPGVGAICTYSPLIDSLGNSVRGLEFFKRLAAITATPFNRNMSSSTFKTAFGNQFDWRVSGSESVIAKFTIREYSSLWWAAALGDELRIRQLAARGIDVNETNYSNRNALNFAISANAPVSIIQLLIDLGIDTANETYLEDARRVGRPDIIDILHAQGSQQNILPNASPRVCAFTGRIPIQRYFTGMHNCSFGDAIAQCGVAPDRNLEVRALCGKLIIPNWPRFVQQLQSCCAQTRISLVSVDDQTVCIGDQTSEVIGGIVRVILYEIAIAQFGNTIVHSIVGKEPSGEPEDSLQLNAEGIPYNPLTMSGCLAVCNLLLEKFPLEEILLMICSRLDILHLAKHTTTRNTTPYVQTLHCLAYMLRLTHTSDVIDFFLRAHDIMVDLKIVATFAKSLANSSSAFILSLMFACGLDQQSGEWSFKFGLPARSNGRGMVMVVIPGIAGYAAAPITPSPYTLAPEIAAFQSAFDLKFSFHIFKRHFGSPTRSDPTLYFGSNKLLDTTQFLASAFVGDLSTMKNLIGQGVGVNWQDQDGRTALHVANESANAKIVEWLIANGADVSIKDIACVC